MQILILLQPYYGAQEMGLLKDSFMKLFVCLVNEVLLCVKEGGERNIKEFVMLFKCRLF